jgi:hypothetical protein
MRSPSAADSVSPVSDQALGEPVDPQPPIRVQHHLDDRFVFEIARDGRAERRAQHPRAAILLETPP